MIKDLIYLERYQNDEKTMTSERHKEERGRGRKEMKDEDRRD